MLTNTEGSGRGRRWALAFAAAVAALLSIAATVALADGEDDPSFDADGTLFSVIDPGVDPVTDPVVDQGHDGGVLTAVGVVGFPTGTDDRGTATSQLRVLRLDAGGVPSGLDGDGLVAVPSPLLGDLFDIEGLADGRIVIASSGFAPPGRARGFGVGDTLVITVLASNGDILDQYLRVAPPECSQGATEEEPYPAVAEIDPTGRVYVVWDDCVESPLLARYVDGVDDSVELIDPMVPVELALGPAGDVFILGATDLPDGAAERAIIAGSIVVRHDGESLDELPYGGGKETAAFLPGDPVDITVDPSNRAVVWTEVFDVFRGSGAAWRLFRLTPGGLPDETWGENGEAVIVHPQINRAFFGHLIAQDDAKIIAIGPGTGLPTARGQAAPQWAIARVTDTGVLDPAWDGDGVKPFDLENPGGGQFAFLQRVGEPGLQRDGKLLVPFVVQNFILNRIPAPPQGTSTGVTRIGLSPGQPAQPAEQPPAPPPPAATPAATPPVTTTVPQQQRVCRSRRSFRIRLRTGRRKGERSPIVSARVLVNGRRVRVTRGDRLRATVNLRNLPKGRFTVRIRLRLKDGGIVRETRRYRTCTKKIESHLGPLRTRPPKSRRG